MQYNTKEWTCFDKRLPHLFQPVIVGTFGYVLQKTGVFIEVNGKHFIAEMVVLDFANKKVVVEFIPIEKFTHWKVNPSIESDYSKKIALCLSMVDFAAKPPINDVA